MNLCIADESIDQCGMKDRSERIESRHCVRWQLRWMQPGLHWETSFHSFRASAVYAAAYGINYTLLPSTAENAARALWCP